MTKETICQVCSIPVSQAKTGRPRLYCSYACQGVAQKLAMNDIPKTCVVCGDTYLTNKWKVTTSKYCSKKCMQRAHYLASLTSIATCDVCGSEYRREPAKRFPKRQTCSVKCRGISITKDWPSSGKWEATRTWFSRKGRMKECAHCGYDKEVGILVVHHKDRDRDNNTRENLVVLCPNCHALEHLVERKSGWKDHQSNSYRSKKRRAAVEMARADDEVGRA